MFHSLKKTAISTKYPLFSNGTVPKEQVHLPMSSQRGYLRCIRCDYTMLKTRPRRHCFQRTECHWSTVGSLVYLRPSGRPISVGRWIHSGIDLTANEVRRRRPMTEIYQSHLDELDALTGSQRQTPIALSTCVIADTR